MDTYCLNRGTLLDNTDVVSLEGPDVHSIHCLVDVERCYASGFELLQDPKEGSKVHCRAYKLDKVGNDKVIKLARSSGKKGYCSTCTGNAGSPDRGFRATIYGRVTTAGTADTPAILSVSRVLLPSEDECANPTPPKVSVCTAATDGPYYLAHGSCMLIGWGILLPTGVITAKLFRHRPNALWFRMHKGLQITGLVIVFIGWIIALVRFDVFQGFSTAALHGGLGMFVMVLGLMQPINAFFRPHPEPRTTKRIAWEIIHKSSGYIAVVVAVVTICLGTTLLPQVQDSLVFQIIYGIVVVSLAVLGGWMYADSKKDENSTGPTITMEANLKQAN